MAYTEQDCIDAVRESAERLGYSPTIREYKQLDLSPSAGTIRNLVGWDNAKELAGLDVRDSTKEYPKPDHVDISDTKWDSLSTKAKRKYRRRVFFAKDKVTKGCQECGYNERAVALDYHHTDSESKEMSVAERISRGHSKEKILEEVERCRVLCANCHRTRESNSIDLSGYRPE
jgi:hypothetical protein